MDKETHSSEKDVTVEPEKGIALSAYLESDVMKSILLLQKKAWPIEKGTTNKYDYQIIEIHVPFRIRRDVLTFVTALFHLLDVDITEWFQDQLENSLWALMDEVNGLPISNYSIKRMIERITGKDSNEE